MTARPSIFKRAYDAVALFALLNVLAVGGLIAYLVAGGVADAETVRRMVAALYEEDPAETEETTPGQPAETETGAVEPAAGTNVVAESQMDMEIVRRESERIKAELDQRLALNNSILLRVTAERERFQRERAQAAQRQKAMLQRRREEGFKRQIAIYESLAPKVALQHLLAMGSGDEAARLLLEMDTRKAKKLVEAAKRGGDMEKMKLILQKVREVAPDRSVGLEPREP